MGYEDENGDYHDDDCTCEGCEERNESYYTCAMCGDRHNRYDDAMYTCKECSDEFCSFCATKHGIRGSSRRPARFAVPRCKLTVALLANDGGED